MHWSYHSLALSHWCCLLCEISAKPWPQWPLLLTFTLIPAWISNYIQYEVCEQITYHRGSLGMDKQFHPTHHWACNYLPVLGLKLNRVSRKGPQYYSNLMGQREGEVTPVHQQDSIILIHTDQVITVTSLFDDVMERHWNGNVVSAKFFVTGFTGNC